MKAKGFRTALVVFFMAVIASTVALAACGTEEITGGDSQQQGQEQQQQQQQQQQQIAEQEKIKVYFDPGYGRETIQKVYVVKGEKVQEPEPLTREGYIFDCWLEDGRIYDFDAIVDEEITLVAAWNKAYTVSYGLGYEDLALTSETIAEGDTAEEPAEPSREGYSFSYWATEDGTEYDFSQTVEGDVELVAVWLPDNCDITLCFGDVTETYTQPSGVTINEVLEMSDALQELIGENGTKFLAGVTDAEGQAYSYDYAVTDHMTLQLDVKDPIYCYIYLSSATGVTLPSYIYKPIRANTYDEVLAVIEQYMYADIDGTPVQVGKITGLYQDAAYTTPYAKDCIFDWAPRIYVKTTWTLSARTLKVPVSVKVFDEDAVSIDLVSMGITQVSTLFNPTSGTNLYKSGNFVKVTYGTNNQIQQVAVYKNGEIDGAYNADENHTYYLVQNNNILVGLSSGSLNGTIIVTSAGTTYTAPSFTIKSIDRQQFSESLKGGLVKYLQSSSFQTAFTTMANANRILFSYLKYLDSSYLGMEIDDGEGGTTTVLQKGVKDLVLDKIKDLITTDEDGTKHISEANWYDSAAKSSNWYGIVDFLVTWSYSYQQYNDYLLKTEGMSLSDNEYTQYLTAINEYLEDFITLYSINGLYTKSMAVSTAVSNLSKVGQSGQPATISEAVENISKLIDEIPEGYDDPVHLEAKQWLKDNLYRLRASGSSNMYSLFSAKAKTLYSSIRTTVSFGYNIYCYFLLVYTNLGFDIANSTAMQAVIKSVENSYYALNADGTLKESTGCNWVGFSGAPISRALIKDYSDKYFVEYEKTQQAYYPFVDQGMTQQGLAAMVNMDRLYDWYNHTLTSAANVAPGYAVLTMYMHGIDPEHYTKGVETSNLDNEYNIIALWAENLGYDADGDVKISAALNMAIAICYLAHNQGVEAPAPYGVVTQDQFVVTLKP